MLFKGEVNNALRKKVTRSITVPNKTTGPKLFFGNFSSMTSDRYVVLLCTIQGKSSLSLLTWIHTLASYPKHLTKVVRFPLPFPGLASHLFGEYFPTMYLSCPSVAVNFLILISVHRRDLNMTPFLRK